MIKKKLPIFYCLLLVISLIACTNYGRKVKNGHIDVYYKDGISQELAQKTADFLYKLDVTENKSTASKSIQLLKKNDTVTFRMVIDKKNINSVTDEMFSPLANILSDSLFNGGPVNIDLTDDHFKTVHSVAYKKLDLDYGPKITVGHVEVYRQNDFNTEDATRLAAYLDKYMMSGADDTKSFQVDDESGLTVKMVSDADKADKLGDKTFNDMAQELSDSVFDGKSLKLELTDGTFKRFRTYRSGEAQPKMDSNDPQ